MISIFAFSLSILSINAQFKAGSCLNPSGGNYCTQTTPVKPSNCYCDSRCTGYKDCCLDYKQVCSSASNVCISCASPTEGCHYEGGDCQSCGKLICDNGGGIKISTGFRNANWQCYDGFAEKQGSSTSCKTSETWRIYAEQSCKGKCNSEGSKCGVNSFNVDVECNQNAKCLKDSDCPQPMCVEPKEIPVSGESSVDNSAYYCPVNRCINGDCIIENSQKCDPSLCKQYLCCDSVNGNCPLGFPSQCQSCLKDICKSTCGNGACENGEDYNCPAFNCIKEPCPSMPCYKGTCPQDCKNSQPCSKQAPAECPNLECLPDSISVQDPISCCYKCKQSLKEEVTCYFVNSKTEQKCSATVHSGGDTHSYSCSGILKCTFGILGPEGLQVVVDSSCDDKGYHHITLDGVAENLNFYYCAGYSPITKQDVINWINSNCNKDYGYAGSSVYKSADTKSGINIEG